MRRWVGGASLVLSWLLSVRGYPRSERRRAVGAGPGAALRRQMLNGVVLMVSADLVFSGGHDRSYISGSFRSQADLKGMLAKQDVDVQVTWLEMMRDVRSEHMEMENLRLCDMSEEPFD